MNLKEARLCLECDEVFHGGDGGVVRKCPKCGERCSTPLSLYVPSIREADTCEEIRIPKTTHFSMTRVFKFLTHAGP